MKSAFNRSILALTAILVVAGASQANAQQKPLKKYESGTKEFWTHPPDDWFLGDETEAQKGLAPPSGPPTGSSDAELATMMKKIKLPAGFNIEVYASNVLAARQMAWGDKGTLFVGSFGLGNVYAIKDNGGKREVKTILKGLNMPTGLAFLDGEAGGHVQPLEDGLDLFLPAIVLDGIDVAEAERADEQRALVTPGHLPRGEHAGRIDLDLEARRQLDLLHHRRKLGVRGAGRRTGWRRLALLGFGLVAQEPIRRRVGPEVLGAGLVLLQGLLLRVGLASPSDNEYCCERKKGSIESRFHRVTPYAAWRLRPVIILKRSKGELGLVIETDRKMLTHPVPEMRGSGRQKQTEGKILIRFGS